MWLARGAYQIASKSLLSHQRMAYAGDPILKAYHDQTVEAIALSRIYAGDPILKAYQTVEVIALLRISVFYHRRDAN